MHQSIRRRLVGAGLVVMMAAAWVPAWADSTPAPVPSDSAYWQQHAQFGVRRGRAVGAGGGFFDADRMAAGARGLSQDLSRIEGANHPGEDSLGAGTSIVH
jgi:hypothetical protein